MEHGGNSRAWREVGPSEQSWMVFVQPMRHLGLIPEDVENYGKVWSRQSVQSDLLLERSLWQKCRRVKGWRGELLGGFSSSPGEKMMETATKLVSLHGRKVHVLERAKNKVQ